jgi:hypothetical protein
MEDRAMTDKPEQAAASAEASTGHRKLALVLVVIATITSIIMAFALWANRQLLETESWTETSSELLAEPAITDALGVYLVDQIYSNVDVQGEIAKRLPPELAPLAGPAAGALRSGADTVAKDALQTTQVQALWRAANEKAHTLFVDAIEGGSGNVSTEGGVVTLDLASIVSQVTANLGLPDLSDKLPPNVAQLEILESNELESAQDIVSLFKKVSWVLVFLTLGLYVVAVAISGSKRRETLRAVGYSFAFAGAVVLLARNWAGNALVESIAENPANETAVRDVWDIGTSMLAEIGGAAVLYGVAIVIAAWIAGPTKLATGIRDWMAPYIRQPHISVGVAVALILLLFIWSPTEGTSRLVPSLILIVLIFLGVEMLRRRTIAEFPDRVETSSPSEWASAIGERARGAWASRRGGAAPASGGDPKLDALSQLADLKERGVLDEQEFAAEKERVLAGSAAE